MNSTIPPSGILQHQQLENQANQLCHIASQNLQHGNLNDAQSQLERALQLFPDHALSNALLGKVLHLQGKPDNARAAFDRAIAAMPVAWGPRFEKAQFLEEIGETRAAALAWRTGLQYMPEPQRNDPQISPLVQRAMAADKRDSDALYEHLRTATDALSHSESSASLRRFNHCLDITSGRRAFITARPIMVAFPELPAISFFDRADFAWAKDVEAHTDRILGELQEISRHDAEGFTPYVKTAAGNDAGQFGTLDRNDDWSAYFLWNQGLRNAEHCERCPETEAATALAPQIHIAKRAPAVFFSMLKPHTEIPPHNGATNARLTVHLPLIIPEHCALQVGDEIRQWKPGELMIFDDTIRHAAWNRSDQRRVVLIFDIWNPLLTPLEQQLVARTIESMVEYYQGANELGEL